MPVFNDNSLFVFWEITAVVFTANKLPRGARHPDAVSPDRFGLLKTEYCSSIQRCLQVIGLLNQRPQWQDGIL